MDDKTQEMLDADLKKLHDRCDQLMTHFDTVQIFATRYEKDTCHTSYWVVGEGNWAARLGHVRIWLLREEEGIKRGSD